MISYWCVRSLGILVLPFYIVNGNKQNTHQQRGELPWQYSQMGQDSTASAMIVKLSKSKKCHFCLEDHVAEDCKNFKKT